MGKTTLSQDEIDALVTKLKNKKQHKKTDQQLSQSEIDSVIQEYKKLTNTDLTQDDIDTIIKNFDREYKPV